MNERVDIVRWILTNFACGFELHLRLDGEMKEVLQFIITLKLINK